MIINLRGGNVLVVFRNDAGDLSVNLADFSGKINLRKIVQDYQKKEGVFIATRTVGNGPKQFLVETEKSLRNVDILKIATMIMAEGGENVPKKKYRARKTTSNSCRITAGNRQYSR